MGRKLLFFFVLLLLFTQFAEGGRILAKSKFVELNFEPGMVVKENYTYWGSEHIGLRLKGHLSQYTTLHDPDPDGGPRTVTVELRLPQQMPWPGRWHLGLVATDVSSGGGTVSTVAQIQQDLYINVPYPGKWAELQLMVYDVEENETGKALIKLTSRGNETINSLSLRLKVVNEVNKTVYQTFKALKPLGPKETRTEEINFSTIGLLPGRHKAIATLFYDSKNATAVRSFKIGSMDVSLLDFTNTIPPNQISQFTIRLDSNWREKLPVYVEIYIDGRLVGTTPTIQMGEFKQATFKSFVDATKVNEGEHQLLMKVHFGDKQHDFKKSLLVSTPIEKEQAKAEPKTLILGVVGAALVLLLAAIVLLIVLVIKHRKD